MLNVKPLEKLRTQMVQTGNTLDHVFLTKINEIIERLNRFGKVLEVNVDLAIDEEILVKVQKRIISTDKARKLIQESIKKELQRIFDI